MPDRPVSLRWARLGAELRRVRLAAGLSQPELGGLHQSDASKIELGRRRATPAHVEMWLRHGTETDRAVVTALLAAAQRETSTWSEKLDGHTHLQGEVRDRNAAAARIRSFQPTVLPGPLQTAEYARRVLLKGRTDVAAAVAARLAGQHLLYEPDRSWEFMVTEDVLSFAVAPQTRAAQIHHITSVATLDAVSFAVVPAGRGARLEWNNFIIRDPVDGSPPYVVSELMDGEREIVDPDSVQAHEVIWGELWGSAITGDDAVAMLREL